LRHGATVRQPASQPVIKEMPGSVASGTSYTILGTLTSTLQKRTTLAPTPYRLDATDEFLLQILLLAQHVSGNIMPIIRSSKVINRS
jgi:hypothetical protein